MRLRKPHITGAQLSMVAVVLAATFALRVWNLGAADLTFDEVATVYVADRTLPNVIRYVMGAGREHPPFYYLLMSLWLRGAGIGEFAVRYPSVLIGVLATAWSGRLGRRFLGARGTWWGLALCAVAPLSVWAGRTGRMYALVMLLSMVTMDSWLRWLARPTWRTWLVFLALSGIGVMTHYYLALLWPVQALLLILLPHRTRPIRIPWLATLVAIGLGFAAFVALSPGIRGMVVEVARRFPVRHFRHDDLRVLVVSLYLAGFSHELAWIGAVALGLTAVGWMASLRRDRLVGALIFAWTVLPVALLHFVPEKLEPRYLLPVLPGLLLSLAGLLSSLRPRLLQIPAAVGLVLFSLWRLPIFYGDPDVIFSSRMRALNIAARPGDALVMNGPWPKLLLRYYHPPEDIEVYGVPAAAPPGYDAEADVARLEAMIADHQRLWVSYGAIHWADPKYSVSRWLAENTHCVYEVSGMALYLPRPEEQGLAAEGIDLGARLDLTAVAVDRTQAQIGEFVRVQVDAEGDMLDRFISLRLGVVDASGRVWAEREDRLGPVHQPTGSTLPDAWTELTGLWLLPGIPPGDYTLGLRVAGDGVETGPAVTVHGWIPIGPLEVLQGTEAPELVGLLPGSEAVSGIGAGDGPRLVGIEPYSERFMQGYPAGLDLWWQAGTSADVDRLQVCLDGPTSMCVGSFPLAPHHYLTSVWASGDVIRQTVTFALPDDLEAGDYHVRTRLMADDVDQPESDGSEGGWMDLLTMTVEARDRKYRVPLATTRVRADFGGVLRLEGYKLGETKLRPGETKELTVYWRALQRPQQIYAVFIHLRAAGNATVWHQDSWPQQGIYTTDHWLDNEVVAETYTLAVPPELPPGTYRLYTGVYDPSTGDRLPGTDGAGVRIPSDEVVLVEIEVVD